MPANGDASGRTPEQRRSPKAHGNLIVAVVAAALVVAAVVVAVSPTRPAVRPVPTALTPASPTPVAVSSGRRYRYIWTGTPGRLFSPSEFEALARDDALVVIEKGYGNTFADWDAAARTLASLHPAPIVLVDFLAGALPPALRDRWGSAFQSRWILRDASGNLMHECHAGRCTDRVDVADPSYRTFIEDQVQHRLATAPYGGVMFDNLHYYDAGQYPDLSQSRIAALNAGFRALIRETRTIAPTKLLFFNGIARNVGHVAVADRGFDLLASANGAQDEAFCYMDNENRFRSASQLVADDQKYLELGTRGRTILESVKLESGAAHADAPHIKRYCFANYLMSYVPGHTYVQFKEFPDQSAGPQIERNSTPEQRLDLGAPVGGFTRNGSVLERRFEHGWVFVNVGTSSAEITVPADVTLSNGAVAGESFAEGGSYRIPATDAAYFLATGGAPSGWRSAARATHVAVAYPGVVTGWRVQAGAGA